MIKVSKGTNNKIFEDAYKIRVAVFSDEQGIPVEHELENIDKLAFHAVYYDGEKAVSCGRLRVGQKRAKLCRIATLPEARHKGYAKKLIQKLLDLAKKSSCKEIYLHSQLYIVPLYESFGFVCEGDEFAEEGILHIKMFYKD